MAYRSAGASSLAALVLLGACGDGTDPPTVDRVVIAPGSQTLFAMGATVQLNARALAADGNTISGVGFSWMALDPAVTVSPSGLVTAVENGSARVVASAETKADTAEIAVLVSECGSTITPFSLAVGVVHELTTAQRADLCLEGAGAEYVLVPFFANAVNSASIQIRLQPNGVVNPSGPPNPSRAPLSAPSGELALVGREGPQLDLTFEHALRERERREHSSARRLASRALRERVAAARRNALAAAPMLGDQLSLNVEAGSACQQADVRTGRVAAISQHAIIVHDVGNPPNGFTDAEYQSIAVTFDTLVYQLAVDAFGQESDIDANGRVIIFYTRAVNELTPQGSGSFVGGFFFGRDLFAKAGSSPCEGSNEAEMFYMLVPDPTGAVNGNERTKDFVNGVTVGTIAHEFQHLINASRRTFVNDAPPEEVWLNEGLSHIAEELTFYRSTGLQPRQNIPLSLLTAQQSVNTAINAFQAPNLRRVSRYLDATESNSPFASNDLLATRGAAWQLLRYLADRTRTADGDIWFQLVNSTTTGIPNVTNAIGVDPLALAGDFVIANYTDDAVSGVGAPFQHPSWVFRELLPAFNNNNPPVRVRLLVDGSTNAITLSGGGAAYVRFGFSGPFGIIRTTAQGAAVPASVRMTLVRTR